jgi:predicted phosphatase
MLRNFMKHVKTVGSILQKVSHMVFNVTTSLKLLFHTVQKVSAELISPHPVFKIMNSTLLLRYHETEVQNK